VAGPRLRRDLDHTGTGKERQCSFQFEIALLLEQTLVLPNAGGKFFCGPAHLQGIMNYLHPLVNAPGTISVPGTGQRLNGILEALLPVP
jgi:hypothetical protein